MLHNVNVSQNGVNVINATGRFIAFLGCVYPIRIVVRMRGGEQREIATGIRQGMSLELPSAAHEIELHSEQAQPVEFWMGQTKLDYAAMVGQANTSSAIVSDAKLAPPGVHLLAGASAFRRRIRFKPQKPMAFGGAGVTTATGFQVAAGEVVEIESRGEVWSAIDPKQVQLPDTAVPVDSNSKTIASLWTTNGGTNGLYMTPDGTLLTANYHGVHRSIDGGLTWQENWSSEQIPGVGSTYVNGIGQDAFGRAYFSHANLIMRSDGQSLVAIGGDETYFSSVSCGAVSMDGNTLVLGDGSGRANIKIHNGGQVRTFNLEDFGSYSGNSRMMDAGINSRYAFVTNQWGLWRIPLSGGAPERMRTRGADSDQYKGRKILTFGDRLFFMDQDGKCLVSDDHAQTFTELGTNLGQGMVMVGRSILIYKGANQLRLLDAISLDLTEIALASPGSALYCTDAVMLDDGLLIKTSSNVVSSDAAAFIPLELSAGERFGVPVSWLEEVG